MSTTQPIRSKQLLHDFKNYYLTEQPEFRNYTIILIGLNTALRINDILHITWGDVYCGERRRFYTHLLITEKKTGKETRILINRELQETLLSYRKTQPSIADTDYLFPSPRKADSPLSRYQAYRIVRKAAEAVGIEDVIRCHSLRKTFGYHAWKMGTPPALLMEIYNHSSFQITKHYLGIEQDDKDKIRDKESPASVEGDAGWKHPDIAHSHCGTHTGQHKSQAASKAAVLVHGCR